MKNGWNNYNYVKKFEETFAKYHNKKYALMTSCCTHAIHLVIKSLNLKKKDEVFIWGSATILPRIKMGKGSTIGDGAVVTKDVKPNTFVAGIPAEKKNKNQKKYFKRNLIFRI